MELREYVRILWRRWWLVVTPAIIVLIFVAVGYSPPPTQHRVVMRFSAGTEPAGLSLDYDRYYPWLTSEYIANGLADIAESGAFAQAVAARLRDSGSDISPGAVQGAIVTDNAQSILVVYVTWGNPAQIVSLANQIAAELTENGASYFPQLANLDPAVRLLDDPAPQAMPPSLRAQLVGPAVKIALAVLVGGALAFVWHYLDPTVREAETLKQLGLDVVARIPRS